MELDVIKVKLGEGELLVPEQALVAAWLEKVMRRQVEPAKPTAATPRIGEIWPGQGGVYAGVMRGENGQPDYHLIVPACDASHAEGMTWGPSGITVQGAGSEYDGMANTVALIHSDLSHPAAEWAANLEIEERCDFYLPARRELRLMWANVPEVFKDGWYWSSTQCAGYSDYAWIQNFTNGSQYDYLKSAEGRVRAVRRLIIQ